MTKPLYRNDIYDVCDKCLNHYEGIVCPCETDHTKLHKELKEFLNGFENLEAFLEAEKDSRKER